MPAPETLATYPYVTVRIGCSVCTRTGSYRLARLAAKYGAEIMLVSLLEQLAGDCPNRRPRHPIHGLCGAQFVDLHGPPQPPHEPGRRLRVVLGGRKEAAE